MSGSETGSEGAERGGGGRRGGDLASKTLSLVSHLSVSIEWPVVMLVQWLEPLQEGPGLVTLVPALTFHG